MVQVLGKTSQLSLPAWKADRLFWLLLVSGLLLDAGVWLFLWLRLPHLPEVLAIHYGANGEADRVGVRNQLYILPVMGAVIAAINLALSAVIYKRDPRLCQMLLSVSIAVQLLVWGAVLRLGR